MRARLETKFKMTKWLKRTALRAGISEMRVEQVKRLKPVQTLDDPAQSARHRPGATMIQRPLVLFGHRIRLYAWWRDVRMAFRTLVGDTTSDQRLLEYMSNRADLARGLQEFQCGDAAGRHRGRHGHPAREHQYRRVAALFRTEAVGARSRAGCRSTIRCRRTPGCRCRISIERIRPRSRRAIPKSQTRSGASTSWTTPRQCATVADASFDFVVAAHVIEHTRNPIATLRTWLRVLKPGGLLYLVVPDKRYTFDRARVRTTLEHVIFDYLEPSRERDLEHFLDYARFVNNAPREEAVGRGAPAGGRRSQHSLSYLHPQGHRRRGAMDERTRDPGVD